MSPPAEPKPSASDRLTPARALVDRFRDDVVALIGAAPCAAAPMGVAVSGGADSVALMLLAAAAWPGGIAVATVDHGLRPTSRDEAQGVAALSAQLGLAHATLPLDPAPLQDGNLQDRARAARYAALSRWAQAQDIRHVATGHQRDDIAESFLMRARRGAGVGGLAAMRPVRPLAPWGTLVRPLLGWDRDTLARIVVDAGIAPVDDPSNADPRFDRARIRALIAASPDLPRDRLASASAHLRTAEDALSWLTDREWHVRCAPEGERLVVDVTDLPYEIRRRLAGRAIAAIGGGTGPRRGLDAFVTALESGRVATLAGVRGSPGDRWRFEKAPPHRSR